MTAVLGCFGIISGLPKLIFPARQIDRQIRLQAMRLSELDSGNDEKYFEEHRALIAYGPPRSVAKMRLLGGLLVGLSLILLVSGLYAD